jgi:hypothetical protein
MKPSEETNVPNRPKYIEIKHYFLRDEVQKREVFLQYISTDEQIAIILVKPLSKMKKFVYSRNKMELVETTSLLKREEITPRLGGSTDVLLIYGQSFFSSKYGSVQDEQFLSSSESGLRFMTDKHFPVRKMVQIGQSFS